MKVTGFTFIKNALIYDYPVVEAIQSILPLCTDFVVAVGRSDDETLQLIQQIDPIKIRIIETVWDETLREGGRVLAVETDKAFAAIADDSDWCFYMQGDEVVHEKYHATILGAMQKYQHDEQVDGLLFHYLHFYGSYDYVATASHFYKKEIRVIRKHPSMYSYRDAQGFRKGDNQKLNVKLIDAFIFHYGWVKAPKAMQAKQENFHKYWHDDQWVEKNVVKAEAFDYSNINSLARYEGTHPQVMQKRIQEKNWQFNYDLSYNSFSIKDRFKNLLYKVTGIDLNYKNYKIIR